MLKSIGTYQEIGMKEISQMGRAIIKRRRRRVTSASIPSEVWFNPNISLTSKALFWVINSLSKRHGYCYATNSYLSMCLDMISGVGSGRQIQRCICELEGAGYIRRTTGDDGARHLKVDSKGLESYSHLTQNYFTMGKPHDISVTPPHDSNVVPPRHGCHTDLEYKSRLKISSLPKGRKDMTAKTRSRALLKIDEARKENIILNYWNNIGAPCSAHRIGVGTKTEKRIRRAISNAMQKHSIDEIVFAIDTWIDFLRDPDSPISHKSFLGKRQSLSSFFKPTPEERKLYIQNGIGMHQSPFEYSLKGVKYLHDHFSRNINDSHPDITQKILDFWNETYHDKFISSDNDFIRCARRWVVFVDHYCNYFTHHNRGPWYTEPLFLALEKFNPKNSRQLWGRYFWETYLPTYLVDGGWMEIPRRGR